MDQPTEPESVDKFRANLQSADDRVRLNHWLPPREGILPHIRIGARWFNIIWVSPIAALGLMVTVAATQALHELPSVQAFIELHPGIAQSAPSVESGFPW